TKAREILRPVPGRAGTTDEDLRDALLRFIGEFSDWDCATNATFLEAGRALVRAAHPGEIPLVVDSFAGGGSIPLEALRLGCEAFASDVNPVAALILKTMLEDMPRRGPSYSSHVRELGNELRERMEADLRDFYPLDANGAQPVAYLWARTIRC